MDQDWNKTDAFAEQMLNNLAPAPSLSREVFHSSTMNDSAPPAQASSVPIYDFGEASFEQEAEEDQPATSLMGMMDSNGREHIEYPPNSGRLWHRDNPDSAWIKD